MKITIAAAAIMLITGSAMAQRPDSMPQVNPPLQADTFSKKQDTAMKHQPDSNLQNWKQPSAMQPGDSAATDKSKTETVSDRVIMKEDTMYLIVNGETAKMEKEYTLPSGTMVLPDGTLRKKDGTEMKLKNGQYIEIPSSKNKEKGKKKE